MLHGVCFFGCFKLVTLLASVFIVLFCFFFFSFCLKQGQVLEIKALVHVIYKLRIHFLKMMRLFVPACCYVLYVATGTGVSHT